MSWDFPGTDLPRAEKVLRRIWSVYCGVGYYEELCFDQRSSRRGKAERTPPEAGSVCSVQRGADRRSAGRRNGGSTAVNLAEKILAIDSGGIRILNDCVPEELYKIEGVGPARAACLLAAAELGRRLHDAPKQNRVSVFLA